MKLRKFFQANSQIILMGASFLVAIGGLYFGVVPLIRRSISTQKRLGALSADVAVLKQKSAVLQHIDATAIRADLITLSSAVPPEKSLASVLSTIDSVSGATGVLMRDFQILKPGSLATESAKKRAVNDAKSADSILNFSVTIDGTYTQVREFLATVESVRRLFHIVSLEVSTIGNSVEARVNLQAFYFPYPSEVGAVMQPIAALTEQEDQAIMRIGALPLMSTESTVQASGGAIMTQVNPDPFHR